MEDRTLTNTFPEGTLPLHEKRNSTKDFSA